MILGEGIVARSRTWALTILEILAWLPKIEPRISERTRHEQYGNFFKIVAIECIPHFTQLEIKPCGLASGIRDIHESYNWSHLLIGEHLDYFLYLFVSRTGTKGWTECQSVQSLYGVWHLAASMEVKNNHAHVTTQIMYGLAVMLSISRFGYHVSYLGEPDVRLSVMFLSHFLS